MPGGPLPLGEGGRRPGEGEDPKSPLRALLVQIERAKFYEPVGPGDQMEIEVTALSTRESSAQVGFSARVGEKRAARGTLTFVLRSIDSPRVHEQRRYVYSLWTRDFSPPLVFP